MSLSGLSPMPMRYGAIIGQIVYLHDDRRAFADSGDDDVMSSTLMGRPRCSVRTVISPSSRSPFPGKRRGELGDSVVRRRRQVDRLVVPVSQILNESGARISSDGIERPRYRPTRCRTTTYAYRVILCRRDAECPDTWC